jgi:16S rRNA U516 pseudouridylate synthase RsuA-like enzyme
LRVFWWKPGTEPKDIGVDFGDLNPEAIMIMRDGDKARILILSDDGKYPGRNGKTLFAACGCRLVRLLRSRIAPFVLRASTESE